LQDDKTIDDERDPDPIEASEGSALAAANDDGDTGQVSTELDSSFDLGVEAVLGGGMGANDESTLVVDVEGFEGPLDVLLALARTQKVDITKISILALAEQFLIFIEEAKKIQLELAADYLVMAAWLAYMKSRLLLPSEDDEDEPTGEELAARLAFQLQRLQAMRNVAAKLFARNRLGRDVFARGAPEGIRVVRTSEYHATLYELLKAYSDGRIRGSEVEYKVQRPIVLALEDARRRLEAILGRIPDWSRLDDFLPTGFAAHKLFGVEPNEAGEIDGDLSRRMRRSAAASTFTAGLELARDGFLDIRQAEPFAPIYIRKRHSEGQS
jgi:segregation and condensation protein A